MMRPVTLSINPTYLCNLRCQFCYLTEEQLSDKTRISIEQLDQLIKQVVHHTEIQHVDLYGGEIGILPTQYQDQLYDTIRRYYSGTINVVTNYIRTPAIVSRENVALSISYDFEHRERHAFVYQRMLETTIPIHLLILATEPVMGGDVDAMIQHLNAIPTLVSVEIKPYSSNQANQHEMDHTKYERFVQRWLTSPVEKKFSFTNEHELDQVVLGNRNSFSDDHVYITPAGLFAVLDFDQSDNEYFKTLNTFDEYVGWTLEEKSRVFTNTHCNKCNYLGRCLSEHLRVVTDTSKSCNGYINLIKWYEHDRVET